MDNMHAIEIESQLWRREWERRAAADARAGLAARGDRSGRLLRLPGLSLSRLATLPAPRTSVSQTLAPRGPWSLAS